MIVFLVACGVGLPAPVLEQIGVPAYDGPIAGTGIDDVWLSAGTTEGQGVVHRRASGAFALLPTPPLVGITGLVSAGPESAWVIGDDVGGSRLFRLEGDTGVVDHTAVLGDTPPDWPQIVGGAGAVWASAGHGATSTLVRLDVDPPVPITLDGVVRPVGVAGPEDVYVVVRTLSSTELMRCGDGACEAVDVPLTADDLAYVWLTASGSDDVWLVWPSPGQPWANVTHGDGQQWTEPWTLPPWPDASEGGTSRLLASGDLEAVAIGYRRYYDAFDQYTFEIMSTTVDEAGVAGRAGVLIACDDGVPCGSSGFAVLDDGTLLLLNGDGTWYRTSIAELSGSR